jgi:transglutaminase-like putative cysteine protease
VQHEATTGHQQHDRINGRLINENTKALSAMSNLTEGCLYQPTTAAIQAWYSHAWAEFYFNRSKRR